MPSVRSRRVAGIVLAWSLPLTGLAGPTFEESLARHRALLDTSPAESGLTPLTLDARIADGVTAALGGVADRVPTLVRPTARGDGGVQLRLRDSLWDGRVQVRLGAAYAPGEGHPATLDESSISTGLGSGRLYASVERRHWGPAWTSSLILDGGSRALPALGWRKDDASPFASPWLSWLGPWRADFFAGRIRQNQGPEKPYLFGARVELMPIDGLEIGLSRSITWGGKGRPQSARSLAKALIGRDNTEDPRFTRDDPSNQLAGADLRYTLRTGEGRSVSAYFQYIGEDEAGGLPSHFIAIAGADAALRVAGAAVRVFAEYTDTTVHGFFGRPYPAIAYRHSVYTAGYVHDDDPLGSPVGGDVRLASVGAFVDAGRWNGALQLHRGFAYATSTLYGRSGHVTGANVEASWQLARSSRLGVALWKWIAPGENAARAQVWWRYAFD